jgi:hypothetical protein
MALTTPPLSPDREKLVDDLLSTLRRRLLSCESFECVASQPVIQDGCKAYPDGTMAPRFVPFGKSVYRFSISGPFPPNT